MLFWKNPLWINALNIRNLYNFYHMHMVHRGGAKWDAAPARATIAPPRHYQMFQKQNPPWFNLFSCCLSVACIKHGCCLCDIPQRVLNSCMWNSVCHHLGSDWRHLRPRDKLANQLHCERVSCSHTCLYTESESWVRCCRWRVHWPLTPSHPHTSTTLPLPLMCALRLVDV